MKSQDIVILLKLVSLHKKYKGEGNDVSATEVDSLYSVRSLERFTGISKSQVNISLNRMQGVGLSKTDNNKGCPTVNKQALLEFIVYGIRYVFPAKLGELTRGVATSVAAPVLSRHVRSSAELIPVWPSAEGDQKGLAVEPLHKNVIQSIKGDDFMYDLLALTDAIRIEQVRTRRIAVDLLTELLR